MIQASLLLILTFDFLFGQILEWLNIRYRTHKLPDSVKDLYDTTAVKKSEDYHLEQYRFGTFTGAISFIFILVILYAGLFGGLSDWLHHFIKHPVLHTLAYFGTLFIASDLLTLPFQWYGIFVIEEKYGFNKMDIQTFILDKLKGYLLGALLGGVLVSALVWLVMWLQQDFWYLFWLVVSAFMLFMNMYYTSLIVPLFNKLTPLEDGELKEKIMAYCNGVGFPLDNVYIVDGSKRSSKANAYFSGIGKKKKIVLFDTLVNDLSHEELVAVLAHEVGHFKKKHVIQTLVAAILQMGLMFFLLSRMIFNPEVSAALGASENSLPVNLTAFGILYTPVSTLLGILMNLISQKNEFEADAFAATTYQAAALQTALKKLSVNNLSNLVPHPAYVFVNYSHPPVHERLQSLGSL